MTEASRPVVLQVQSSLICRDIEETLIEFPVKLDILKRDGPNFQERLLQAMERARPHILFSVNFNPFLSEVADRFKALYVSWNVDNVLNSGFCAPEHNRPCNLIFCIDRPGVALYRERGYQNVFHLPIGAEIGRLTRHHAAAGIQDADVSFVGSSVARDSNEYPAFINSIRSRILQTSDPFEQKGLSIIIKSLEEIVELECRDFFVSRVKERLAEYSRRAGFDMAAIWGDPEFFFALPAKEISSRKRLKMLEMAVRAAPVDVYGDEGWNDISLSGVRYKGFSDHGKHTPIVYKNSRVNLNIERVYNTSSVNLRIVECLACGGFVLTEPFDDLAEFFKPGRDLDVFYSMDELRDKITFYLKHDQQRRAVADAGRQVACRDFTLRNRLSIILSKALGHSVPANNETVQ